MSSSQTNALVGEQARDPDVANSESEEALQGTQDHSEHADGSVAQPDSGDHTSARASTSATSDATMANGLDALSSLLSTPTSELDSKISGLKEQREKMKKDKTRIVMELRAQERKRQRLQQRARQLGANDLLEVYAMRLRAMQANNSSAAER